MKCLIIFTEHVNIACYIQLSSFVKNRFHQLCCCNVFVNFQLWNIKVCVIWTTSDSIYWTNYCALRPVWIKLFHFQTQSPPWHLPPRSTQTSSHRLASEWKYKGNMAIYRFLLKNYKNSGVPRPPCGLGRTRARTSAKTISSRQWLIWRPDQIILINER